MSNIKLVHSGGNSVSLTTPDSNPAANRTFKLPGADGSSGQFLKTDGSGALSFATPSIYTEYLSSQSLSGGNTYTATISNNPKIFEVSLYKLRVVGSGNVTMFRECQHQLEKLRVDITI